MSSDDDSIFKALADPTRRELLDILRSGPRTTGELCEAFEDLSRFAVMKHLTTLEQAGLVTVRREGRFRWNYLNPVPIRKIYERWISRHMGERAEAMLALKRRVESKNRK